MAVIRHFEASAEERAAYLKMRRAVEGALDDGAEADEDEEAVEAGQLSPERYAEMSAAEDLILTITARGTGKLSSSHDYPVRGRGGQGVAAMDRAMRGGRLVAAFPVDPDDQIMLATSTGQSIRCPVDGISFRSRSAGGVKVFNTAPARKSSRSRASPIRAKTATAGRRRLHPTCPATVRPTGRRAPPGSNGLRGPLNPKVHRHGLQPAARRPHDTGPRARTRLPGPRPRRRHRPGPDRTEWPEAIELSSFHRLHRRMWSPIRRARRSGCHGPQLIASRFARSKPGHAAFRPFWHQSDHLHRY
jgi:hypothetical protein